MACRRADKRPRRRRQYELLPVLILLLVAPAAAHPPPRATDVAESTDGRRLAVRLDRGIVVSHDAGASWRLRCALGVGFAAGVEPAMAWAGDELLVATPQGLRVDAVGCAPRPAWPGLDGVAVSSLVADGAGGFWAATSQAGVDNHLWRSRDGGRTWAPQGSTLVDTFISQLAVAPGDRLYAAGVRLDDSGAIEHFVRRTDDAGQSWAGGVVDLLPREHRLVLLGSAAGQPDLVFVAAQASRDFDTPDRLLRSGDGGESFDDVTQAPDITGLASSGADVLWMSTADGLSRSVDSGRSFEPVAGVDGPLGCVRTASAGALLLCGEHFVGAFGLARFGPATGAEVLMAWTDIDAPVPCADEVCAEDWADWQLEIFPLGEPPAPDEPIPDPSAPAEDPPSQADSGCRQSGRCVSWPLSAALLRR